MSVYVPRVTTSKHGIDSTDVTSVVHPENVFLEDETEMQSGYRCYPLKSLICH